MSPELQAAYDEAVKPFYEGGGAITAAEAQLKSWRYFLEINSMCNLHCPSCTKGGHPGYEHENGLMPMDLMEKILDKIKSENPNAIVFTYGNSEPFLHPRLPDCISAIKSRGLHPHISTNLNYLNPKWSVGDLLQAGPDQIIISLSGFTQEVYVKGHAGGDIEKVKANMVTLAHANNELPIPQNAKPGERTRIEILVNYHIYRDNEHELPLMQEYSKNLGLGIFTSFARAISMENAIQYCRSKDPEATPYDTREGQPDWNHLMPPVGKIYSDVMERIHIRPDQARKMYSDLPEPKVCPVGSGGIFTFIRHDGKTELCPCVADRRITIADYLTATPEQFIESRVDHPICKQCKHNKLNYYFHIQGRDKWMSPE